MKQARSRANLFGLMTIRAVILWVHVACGVVWVGACATFILAAAGLAGDANEVYAFAARVVPQLNQLCIPLAFAIPITGIGNLFFAARARGSALPTEFVGIVAVKAGLLALMGIGLFRARHNAIALNKSVPAASRLCATFDIREITGWYWLMTAAGIAALGLGLWLSGT